MTDWFESGIKSAPFGMQTNPCLNHTSELATEFWFSSFLPDQDEVGFRGPNAEHYRILRYQVYFGFFKMDEHLYTAIPTLLDASI